MTKILTIVWRLIMTEWEEIQTILHTIEGDIIEACPAAKPEDLGLDRRAGYKFYLGDDFIAVSRSQDRGLQYYGGFEYVDKENRMEVGDIVLYSTLDERVLGHWEQAHEDDDFQEGGKFHRHNQG
jgi:hypothetical protein